MMRYGLPTQDEINRWDDLERAKGCEMVRVIDTAALVAQVEKTLAEKNLELWVSPEFLVGWGAAAISTKSKVCQYVAYGPSKEKAIVNLLNKLKFKGIL